MQHGGREGYSTNTVKLVILYQAVQNKYSHSLFLDLSKAFDKVNIDREIRDKSFDHTIKTILKGTLEIYKYINIDINGEQIYFNDVHIQCFVDDIIVESKFEK